MPTRTRTSPSIAVVLIKGCSASLLGASLLSTVGGALASGTLDEITVHRASCSTAIERCPHRYRESDFAEFGVPFSKNLAGTETVLHIVPMLRMAQLRVYPKDRLHFDRDGELVGMTARYDRDLLGSLNVAHSVPFRLHPNGMPESVTLRWKSSYRGEEYPTGARLTLDDDGAVLSSTFGESARPALWTANAPLDSETTNARTSLDGIHVPSGTLVVVGERERRMEVTFTEEFLFRDTTFAPGTVVFEPDVDGVPRFTGGTLARDQHVQGIALRATERRTSFHVNGLLVGGILDGDQDIEGWPLRDGSAFERHSEGPLRRGIAVSIVSAKHGGTGPADGSSRRAPRPSGSNLWQDADRQCGKRGVGSAISQLPERWIRRRRNARR